MCIEWIKERCSSFPVAVNSLVRRHPKTSIGALAIAVVGLTTLLAVKFGIALSFAFLSIAFATFFASRSLRLTRDSLELTRNAVRPFLSMSEDIAVEMGKGTVALRFTIRNSGSLPARGVHTNIDFFGLDEQVEEDNVSDIYPPPCREAQGILVFPNNHYSEVFNLDLNNEDDMQLWNDIQNGKVKCRVRTIYSSLDKEHVTIQTEQIVKLEDREGIYLLPTSPQKAE